MPSHGESFSPSGGAFAGANGRGEALFSGGYHRLFVQEQRDGGTYTKQKAVGHPDLSQNIKCSDNGALSTAAQKAGF